MCSSMFLRMLVTRPVLVGILSMIMSVTDIPVYFRHIPFIICYLIHLVVYTILSNLVYSEWLISYLVGDNR